MASPPFRYKRFLIDQEHAAHPSGTDGVLLGAWAGVGECRSILDIGTGTGLVALFLAQRTENQPVDQIVGVETDPGSSACAARNFKASPWSNRLFAVEQRVQHFAKTSVAKFDLIVSNPPFFNAGSPAPEPARRQSRRTDTLSPDELLDAVLELLAPRGRFCAILPPNEGRQFCEKAACRGLYFTQVTAVLPRKGKPVERLLLEFERQPYNFRRSQLAMYEHGEQPSAAFMELTAAFYLDF